LKFSISEQREVYPVLRLEFRLRFDGIRTATYNGGIESGKLCEGVTKLGRFIRSTGRIGLGIEIEDQVFAAIIRERNRLAVVGSRAKIGSLVTLF
jgi:hypothetical protein